MLSIIISLFGATYIFLKKLVAPNSPFFVSGLILITNILVFFLNLNQVLSVESLVNNPTSVITYAFSHATLGHLIGNMIVLLLILPYTETMLGSFTLAWVYLLGSVLLGFGWVVLHPDSSVLGASGMVYFLFAMYPFLMTNNIIRLASGIIFAIVVYQSFIYTEITACGNFIGNTAHSMHLSGAILGLITYCFLHRKTNKNLNKKG